uniref:Neprosin PEP catalytic domain-containing protein n=1 Tax=Brassica campestris TaxID=3711 RepID=M4CLN3_BRACM
MGGFFSVPLSGDQVSKDVSHASCFKPNYINSLEEKLAAMQRDMEELKARQTDVLRRVESEEETRSTQRTAEVKVWLKNVDNISRQVSYLINNSAAELQKLSRSGLCSKNLRSNCGYGDRVALMSKKLNDLKSESVTKTAEKENVTLDASAIEELQHLERPDSLKRDISSGSALKKLFSAHGLAYRIEELCIRDLQRDEAHLVLPTTMEQLRKIGVERCPALRKLPLSSGSCVGGDELIISYSDDLWLERVQWEDKATEERFLLCCEKADGYKTTGCYNTNCPGFIIVTRNPSIGNIFKLSSVYGGDKTVIFTPHVYQDVFTPCWALKVDDEMIGYWPGELFTHLKNGASRVRFGGNTYISPDGISPPMGNGHFPLKDYQRSSSFLHVKLTNHRYQTIEAKTILRNADSRCFRLMDRRYTKENGKSFSYGGAGGRCGI